jgi:hypothetical protein
VIYAAIPVVLAVVAMALGRRLATLLLIVAYLTIEGFLKLLSNYDRIVHVGLDIIVLSVGLWLVLGAVAQRRAHLQQLPWIRLVALYALWVVLQLLNPYSPGLLPSVASFKVHLAMIPLYFIAASVFESERDVRRFLIGLVVIGLVPFVMALGQYALGPASVLDLSPRFWQNISYFHEWRPFGTSALPGGASVFAYLVVPAAVVLLVTRTSPSVRVLALLAILLAAGTFVVSGVRQVFLGCVLTLVTMAALLLMRARSGGIAGLVVVAVVGLGAYVGVQTWLRPMATEAVARERRSPQIWRERDVTQRLGTLGRLSAFQEARQNPVSGIVYRAAHYPFGAGLGRTGSAAGTFQASYASDPESARIQATVGWSDNFFSDMIVETGIPGAVMLTAILLGMLWGAVRLSRRAHEPAVVATAAMLAGFYVSVLAMSWGSQPLLSNPITAFFWIFSGMLAAMMRLDAAGAAEPEDWEESQVPTGLPAAAPGLR